MTLNTINQNKKIHMCMKIKLISSNQPISSGFLGFFFFYFFLKCQFILSPNSTCIMIDKATRVKINMLSIQDDHRYPNKLLLKWPKSYIFY